MFNKLYKSANEKFSSDAARDRFLASLDQSAVRKKKNIRPVIASAAALAACFAVTVFGINLYNSRPIPNDTLRTVPQITASPNTAADAPDAPIIAEDTAVQNQESSRPAKTERTHSPANERSTAPQSKETAKSAETAPAADNSSEKSSAEPPEISNAPENAAEVSAPSVPTETEQTKKAAPEIYSLSVLDEAAPENAAANNAAADNAAADESVPNVGCFAAKSAVAAERTLEDYNSLIGRDIRDGICIPEGMTDLTPLTDTAGDGWIFVYDGNGKHVQIRTTPSVQAETNSAGGASSAARASGGTLRFSAGGIDFEITAEGLSGEELDALAASLEK